jgi:hypothetical protein
MSKSSANISAPKVAIKDPQEVKSVSSSSASKDQIPRAPASIPVKGSLGIKRLTFLLASIFVFIAVYLINYHPQLVSKASVSIESYFAKFGFDIRRLEQGRACRAGDDPNSCSADSIAVGDVNDKNVSSEDSASEDDASSSSSVSSSAASGSAASAKEHVPKGANADGKPLEVKMEVCEDRHQQCVGYARAGECEKNPGWMIVNCPHSCKACHLRDPKVRCDRNRLGISNDHIYEKGDMNAMFSSIQKVYGNKYNINVLSTDPWVVTFDNFLTDREINALITSVNGNWERSTDTGTSNEFGETGRVLSQGRTSNNAWCREECNNNPDVQNIMRKISEITWVPTENFEAFQVLRYEIGQKYNAHHDASSQQTRLSCGTRILTFFLYLSDVEEGGETAFPLLNIAVKPKKGSALLWPSTYDHEPNGIDHRTLHEAKPVIRGTKFAANTWIHSHDFKTSNLHGCTGTFDALS